MRSLLSLTALLAYSLTALAADRFSWWMSPESNIVGYFLITGPRSQFYTRTNLVMGRMNTNETLTLPGVTYTVVQAVTVNGLAGNTNEVSFYSNEVITTNAVVVRPAAPLMLKSEPAVN